MERLETFYKQNPGLREAVEQKAKEAPGGPSQANYRAQAIVNVPVVVHIVLTNPFLVTDADVQSQITRLNIDFAGLNADSTNVPPAFAAVRGHSQIQFCLARRTPAGLLTSGVERRASTAGSNVNLTTDPIKRTSLGGLDVWDPTQYLNLWVGIDNSGQGILGYAQFPGSGAAADDGVFLNYQSFGENTCSNIAIYNRGRTGSHEVGHYFGLYHIWGDDVTACTGDDFRQLPSASCTLPTGLFNPTGQGNTATDVGDTPNQAGQTTNCPTGTATDACAAPTGKMYQNFMDYTADNCYSMFTIKQVQRMEWVVDNCRASLKTSLGCQPPASAIALDAAPASSVNPGGSEVISCVNTTYPSVLTATGCGGTVALQPKVRVVNNGTTTLTSLTVGYRLDNGAANSQTVTGLNIPTGGTQVIALTPTATVTIGTHTFKFYTSAPNGGTDAVPVNDTLTQTLTLNAPAALNLPVSEGFESTTFPPAPWTVVSVNATGTKDWARGTPGNNSTGALFMNNYLNSDGAIDDFRSGQYAVNPTDSVRMTFDVAYRPYDAASPDSLLVLVSNDCGVTFTQIYKKWGSTVAGPNTLSTILTTSTASFTPASSADWRKETVVVPSALLNGGKLQFVFRSRSRFGNNIWVDNINIDKVVARDLKLVTLLSPSNNVCANTVSPQVTVTNNGLETINSFTLSYTLDGAAVTPSTVVNTPLAPGASTTVTLATANVAPGTHTIVVTVAGANFTSGGTEQELGNNSLTATFTVVQLRNTIQEGFEATPTGWTVFNPDADNTWVITTPGRNSARSAFIDNYDYNVPNHIDDLRSPFVNTGTYDSLFVSFDVSYRNYPGVSDTLRVMAVTGCGSATVPTSYVKYGTNLATGASLNTSFLTPTAGEWRRESLALGRSVLGSGSNVLIAFRNINEYGNNIFIDNVNIIPLFRRDLQLVSINQPAAITCSTSITPSVTVKNNGTEAITGYKVQYSLDNGAPQTATVVTGVSIPRFGTATISLNTATTTLGVHTIRVYSFEPVTASGTGDEYTANDTLTRSFNVLNTVSAPLVENFTGTAFPPANWAVINPDGGITWKRNAAGNKNAGSAYLNTFNYTSNGQTDDLVTPFVRYTGVDSVRLSFDLAAATFSYPGSTEIPLDTLEILASKDCGNTFTSVYKKFGADLQTLNAPNDPQSGEFTPVSANQWRMENINLSQFSGDNQIALIFRVTNNFENNIFIDNVNLSTQTLPTQLKQNGYVVYPTNFNSRFSVWHYQTPTTLKFLNVYNSAGQLVWSKQFSGNADRQMTIDLTGKAAGMYMVELGYTDASRNVTQKVVKY